METKKSPKADLQNKRSIALLVGLIIAMVAVIGIFSWSQKEKVIQDVAFDGVASDYDVPPVIVEDKPQAPTAPKLIYVGQKIVIVDNGAKGVDLDPSFWNTLPKGIDMTPYTSKPEDTVDEPIPVVTAEEMPTFQGGDINTFRSWCASQIIYPQVALNNGVQGTVNLSFIVERDGSISNVKIVRGADSELNNEAIRVVSSSPRWNPGKNRGKAVRFTYNMPINFVIQ